MSDVSSKVWQTQTAKNRLSEVIDKALKGSPQLITRHGKPAVYVISANEYERLTREKGPKRSLKEILLSSPHKDLEVPIQRQKDPGRDICI
ncbi:MAG TPA: type II toxin-antitoxin system Phd/YefM family antitoxin [Firmicutes bacterium]|nr:type II toxin-antitoxin system Phd/YefM family antitoxin [Bacillota bacterium]